MKGDTISRSALKDQFAEYIAIGDKRFVEGMLHYRKIVLDAIDNAPTVAAAKILGDAEADNAVLRRKLDAAIEDIRRIAPCSLCKHNGKQSCKNEDAGHEKCFEWRGEQEGTR